MKAYTSFSTTQTPQSQPIPGSTQKRNNAGGFAWGVDDWTRLERFLILGSEGGTYYVGEQRLTRQNAEAVLRCIKKDGIRVVERVVEISHQGRAPKNDPALFVLAMAAGEGDKETRSAAMLALPKVARIGTHLFNFLTYCQQFRGWGRLLREGVASWYTEKDVLAVSYQAIKYRQRNGWTHRDVLRKAHPVSKAHNPLFRWITQKEVSDDLEDIVKAFIEIQREETGPKEAARLIRDHNLPREAVPTRLLNNVEVWEALLEKMPMTAMIRNLGKMTSIGLLEPMSDNAVKVAEKIGNRDYLKKARIHPLSVLVALKTYQSGSGARGNLQWNPISQIVDALDGAFYLSFRYIEPTHKRIMLCLDVSGSMTWYALAGMPFITPHVGSAAMALVTANVEKQHMICAFGGHFQPIDISPKQRLDDVCKTVSQMNFGKTDCALPMLYAIDKNLNIDAFCVYTDSETWFGSIHPAQALKKYRQVSGIDAKLIVIGMESNGFSIADPNDPGMMDIVGFDTATPAIISNFIKGG